MSTQSESTQPRTPSSPSDPGSVRVWDPVVRLSHWTVVAGCSINLMFENGGIFHRAVGYAVATAAAIRIVWGFLGRGHARFSTFIPRPAALGKYLRQLYRNREPRYVGHNPAGAIMSLALLALLVGISTTGWMLGLDRYYGNHKLQALHEGFAMAVLPLVGVHVLAAVFESLRHHENLFKAMVTGRKRRAAGDDIDRAIDSD